VEEDDNLRSRLELPDELCENFGNVVSSASNFVEEDADAWGCHHLPAPKFWLKPKSYRPHRAITGYASGNRVVS